MFGGSECSIAPLRLSAEVVALMACCHLLAGVALGWLLSQPRLPLRGVLDAFVSLPLVFPPIAIGFFLLVLLGRNGAIGGPLYREFGVDLIFTPFGVYLAAFIAGLPLIVKPIQAAFASSATELAEASYVLGRGRVATLLLVILPSIRGAVFAGLALSLGRALGEVGITLMLGGNIIGRTDTMSLAIFNSVLDGNFDCAMNLSLLLGAVSLGLFLLFWRLGSSAAARV